MPPPLSPKFLKRRPRGTVLWWCAFLAPLRHGPFGLFLIFIFLVSGVKERYAYAQSRLQ